MRMRGPTWHQNSCFLDALVVALLHAPTATMRQLLDQPHTPLAAELATVQHKLGQSAAHTCQALRAALQPVLVGRGYEDPADGRARDALEVLKAMLGHLRCPDVLWATRASEIWQDAWRSRRLPTTARYGILWTVQLPTAARTLAATLHQVAEQQVEGQLEAEDVQEMRTLHGQCRSAAYSRRRDAIRLEKVDGDLLLIEMERLYLGAHGQQKRSVAALAPDPLRIGDDHFAAISLVCHAHHHYTCLVRQDQQWRLYDDRDPALQPAALHTYLPQVVLYVYKKVLPPGT